MKINDIEKTIEKFNATKSKFVDEINKIDKLLARLSKNKWEKTNIIRIRNEIGDITTDYTEIKRIIKK